jgi:hypothetical protein
VAKVRDVDYGDGQRRFVKRLQALAARIAASVAAGRDG